MRLSSTLRKLVLLGLAMPSAYLGSYAPQQGVPTAEGCSGAGSFGEGGAASWGTPFIVGVDAGSGEAVEIASDGFFLIELDSAGVVDATSIPSELAVEVKTADGDLVPGRSMLLDLPYAHHVVGWSADSELPIGSVLDAVVTVKAETSLRAEATLEVTGPPTPVATGTLVFDEWWDYRHGVGEAIECERDYPDCGGGEPILAGEERRVAIRTSWTAPDVRGFVHWEAWVELPARLGEGLYPSYRSDLLSDSSGTRQMGTLIFPTDTNEYCGRLVVRDLRNNQQVETELCEDSQPATSVLADDDVGDCDAPPNAARTETWCALNPDSELAACEGLPEPPRGGGKTPPSGSTPSPGDQDDPEQAGQGDAERGGQPRLRESCQLAPPVPAFGARAGGSALLLLGLLGRRALRRRA